MATTQIPTEVRFPAQSVALKSVLFFLGVFAVVFFGLALTKSFSIDENVFIASAALMARHGLIPYRDFHYNHLPTLVFVYAFLFRFSNHLLLTARIFSTVCAAGAATAIFTVAYRGLTYLADRPRFFYALALGAALPLNPYFTHTAGEAWNHDFPVLVSLLAFLAACRGMSGGGRPLWMASAGALFGIAFTSRLTFATDALPLALFMAFYPSLTLRRRAVLAAMFTLGCLVACLPGAWVWMQAPGNAYFDNFLYPALNTRFHMEHDDASHRRYTLITRLWFFITRLWEMPGNGGLTILFAWLGISALRDRVISSESRWRIATLAILAIAQVAAGLVPSPPFVQYFYAATPWLLLGVVLCLIERRSLPTDKRLQIALVVVLVVTGLVALPAYRRIVKLNRLSKWVPLQTHRAGLEIAKRVPAGRVLTVWPLYPLEGGLDIYPQLATGRFGIRVGDYLTNEQRKQYLMYGPADVPGIFATSPPAAVLEFGNIDDTAAERAFDSGALQNGYHRETISGGAIWIASH